jgi:hypothetical protein
MEYERVTSLSTLWPVPQGKHYFHLVRAMSPTAVGNRYCVSDGRPHPHHTDGDTSFFRPSNQRYDHMPMAFGLTALPYKLNLRKVLSD